MRVIVTFVLLMALSFSCVIWLIISDVRPRYLEAVEESVVDTAEILAAMLSEQTDKGCLPLESIEATMHSLRERSFSARIYNIVKKDVSLQVYVTDSRGLLLFDSSGRNTPGTDFSRWRDVYLTLRGHYGARSTRTIADDPSSQVLFVAAPVIKDGETVGVVSVGKPTNSISFLITIAKKRFVLSLALVALAAGALSVALSFWITRPVKELTRYANAIRAGKKECLPHLAAPEVRDLGRAMEEMQAKLEGKNYIEDYVRALTHELKSPLTGIKGAGEILREQVADPSGIKFLNNIDTEVDRLHSLVDRMLQLSRLENVRTVRKELFRADMFFQALTDSFQTQTAARGITLACTVQRELLLEGDAFLLRQATANLIGNAIDFSPPGSSVAVNVERTPEGTVIQVRDQGEGMPDFALDKAFNKFFSLRRPGTGKKSTGLGLPFVAEVMSLHGGSVSIRNARPGLEATMTLPAHSISRTL